MNSLDQIQLILDQQHAINMKLLEIIKIKKLNNND